MQKIFSEFTFDSEATQVATPLVEVLERRRGVCQDFAHLMLACLRSRAWRHAMSAVTCSPSHRPASHG